MYVGLLAKTYKSLQLAVHSNNIGPGVTYNSLIICLCYAVGELLTQLSYIQSVRTLACRIFAL